MKIEFTRDKDHDFSPARSVAYKKGMIKTVPREFGEACVKDGSGVDVVSKAKVKRTKPAAKTAQDKPTDADTVNGDRP